MSSQKTKRRAAHTAVPFKHKMALFVVYLILFLTIFAMIDYYAYDILNPLLFIGASLVAAFYATYLHVRQKTKTKADTIAHEIEEIL